MDPHEGFTFFFGSVNSGLVEFSFFPQMTSSLDLLKLGKELSMGHHESVTQSDRGLLVQRTEYIESRHDFQF